MHIANFSVKNPVLVNLAMVGLFIFGTISLLRMPTELNPKVDFNWVFVNVPYPGASPNETESLIIDPIETEIQDVDGIDEIQSTAGEGLAFILIKFKDISEDVFQEKFTEIKSEIDKVDLPEEAEDPIIDDFDSSDFLPVITINMAYDINDDRAQRIADDLEDDLTDLPGVAKVQVSGLAEREIWVQMDAGKMNEQGITFNEVVGAIQRRNLNVPGGNLTIGKSEYAIRSLGRYQSVEDIARTIVRMGQNGDYVTVGDVAAVKDRREEMPIYSRVNGQKTITFSVSKKGEANSIDVIDDIKALINTYQQKAPPTVTFSWTNDNSVYIMRVIRILRNNAVTGMLLIILVLYFFLGKSNALLASLGIPISFFIAFIFMNIFGYSLNGSTLFALVMVLGIIVDDAIIVVENCHRYRLKGYSSREAAVLGTKEVGWPILSSIATNIAAFLPLILLPGIMGKFMRIIPIVFALALLSSLFEAFFLLPSHYGDWTVRSDVYKRGEKKFFKRLRRRYGHFLIKVLRWRYAMIGGLVAVFVLSLFSIRYLGVELFPEEDFDQFKILIKMPEGTSLDETDRIVRKFEQAAATLPQSAIQDVVVNAGLLQGNEEWLIKKNVAQVLFQLHPKEDRDISIDRLITMMREKSKTISGPTSVEFEQISGGPPVGKPISVKVQGKFLDNIKAAALALQDSLKQMPGTYDISDDFPPGKKQIRIRVDQEKAALYGFHTQYVAFNVRYAFDGVTATEYKEGDDEVDVVVKYDLKNRQSLEDILYLKITNPAGQTVPLRELVHFEIEPGPTEIKRFDQERTIMVTGQIDEEVIKLNEVNERLMAIFPQLENRFEGIEFEIGGQFEEFASAFQGISRLFVLSLILIFIILGTQFNSYAQPLIIMTTVPFALIGATLGLVISGNPFSITAMYGFVALAGIVVNDAIIMMDFMNNRRAGKQTTGMQYWRSIVNSGRLRLRPIILTSVTTISGLVPMAFGIGGISLMWSPLANVILFGMLVSTLLTLFVVPTFMAILDDIKKSRKKARQKVLNQKHMLS
ncbi:MAG: hypothetical protein GF313_09845 [Caldithrix sp.]|nr:hypothetical protein [Caldithrix sp.]